MEKGKLIVVEDDCDGIGKTTQYDMLCKKFQSEGRQIANHYFPSYGTLNENIAKRCCNFKLLEEKCIEYNK